MNAGKKGEGSGKSGLSRNRLFGAFGHVHNPFSANSRRGHNDEDYGQVENFGNLRGIRLRVELTKAEATMTAQNLIARLQKS